MIRGLDIFRERFRQHEGSLVLIGGAACDDWFSRQDLTFRVTKDLDVVLLIEAVNQDFVVTMRQFIEDGGYEIRERSDGGPPVLYRFAKPAKDAFPAMLELFSRGPTGIELGEGQRIVPVTIGDVGHSLSAILVDESYYELLQQNSAPRDGIAFADVTALIPLKARAWLDLTERRHRGERVDSKAIDKHRNDVFRLAGTLPGEPGPEVSLAVRADISRFLDAFPERAGEWEGILASLERIFGRSPGPAVLRKAIKDYFTL
ncbi:MAG: hypothetical protein R3E97_11385 [Candidatus Eisenbacteria bacterium]